ncbi:MAG: DoxX family protein, partial [Actinomycetia bacterium]|nr:DoxX family protein [Actinomycetes bacterium]
MNRKKWIYWSLKIMFAVVLGGSALAKLARSEQLTQTFNHLGYPSYLLNILGIGYLLGLVGLFQSKVPILREWAYA